MAPKTRSRGKSERIAKKRKNETEEEPAQNDDKQETKVISNNAEGEIQEEEEEDTEPDFTEPIMDGRTIELKVAVLNPHLCCPLCSGYFKDASTIKECLHTCKVTFMDTILSLITPVCRSCLFKSWSANMGYDNPLRCPVCDIELSSLKFDDMIVEDRIIQNLIDKIFPEIVQKDNQVRLDWNHEHQLDDFDQPLNFDNALKKRRSAAAPKKKKVGELKFKEFSQISFEIQRDPTDTKSIHLNTLPKPFLKTKSNLNISNLKKYIANHISPNNPVELDVTYKGEILGEQHSMEYIFRTKGLNLKDCPLFYYKVREMSVFL